MKIKTLLRISLFFLCISLFQNKAFSQEKYLIVLDVQEFTNKSIMEKGSVREMIQNVNTLISHFKPENVIYVKADKRVLNITLKGFSIDTFPASAFDSSLNVINNNIFTKVEGDAFTSATLINFLKTQKVKEIVLVGLMAEKCIYNTALGGKDKGYNITIVPEGIVGMTPKKKDKAIKKMKDYGIKFVSMAKMFDELYRD